MGIEEIGGDYCLAKLNGGGRKGTCVEERGYAWKSVDLFGDR